jgi:purine-nucleoside phosphorylase
LNGPAARETVERARIFAEAAGVAPKVGLILGSGLAPLADAIDVASRHDTVELPGFPLATAPGHHGRLLFGTLGGAAVAAFQGRLHVYEGHSLSTVALPARVLCGLDVDLLIATNAAGCLHAEWAPGDVMLIRDHLNLLGGSPLEGPNDDSLGPRFPDQSDVYPRALRELLRGASRPHGLILREGVYAAWRGPQFETPAEVAMIGKLGGDTVGMSTVPEAIVAAHQGVPVLGLSVVTNWAAGIRPADQPEISADEVLSVGRATAPRLAALLAAVLPAAAEAAAAIKKRLRPSPVALCLSAAPAADRLRPKGT